MQCTEGARSSLSPSCENIMVVMELLFQITLMTKRVIIPQNLKITLQLFSGHIICSAKLNTFIGFFN